MSLQTEQRAFTIGRQVGGCGRSTRFVFGLLGLAYIGASVAHFGPSAALIGQIAVSLLLTVALYLVLFWLPAVFIFLPGGWGLGVLLYWSLTCLVAAVSSYGGCEVVVFPSLLFRRQYTVYCLLNAIDLIERRYTKR